MADALDALIDEALGAEPSPTSKVTAPRDPLDSLIDEALGSTPAAPSVAPASKWGTVTESVKGAARSVAGAVGDAINAPSGMGALANALLGRPAEPAKRADLAAGLAPAAPAAPIAPPLAAPPSVRVVGANPMLVPRPEAPVVPVPASAVPATSTAPVPIPATTTSPPSPGAGTEITRALLRGLARTAGAVGSAIQFATDVPSMTDRAATTIGQAQRFDMGLVRPPGAKAVAEPSRELPPIPETADPRYLRAVTREILDQHYPGVPAIQVLQDEVRVAEVDRRLRERFWGAPPRPGAAEAIETKPAVKPPAATTPAAPGVRDRVREFGRMVTSYWEDVAKQYPSRYEGKHVVDEPSLLLDPLYLTTGVVEMVPSLAAAMIPGAGAVRAIQVAGRALRLTPQLVLKLARIGAAVTMGTVGGGLEGMNTYEEVLRRGGSTDEAARAATLMTLAAAGLNALSFGKVFGAFGAAKPGLAGRARHAIESGVTEAITEALEEPSEALILGDDVIQALREQGLDVAVPAFLTGGLLGAASAPRVTRGGRQPRPAEPSPETQETLGRLRAVDALLRQNEANLRELDTAATSQLAGLGAQRIREIGEEEVAEADRVAKTEHARAAEVPPGIVIPDQEAVRAGVREEFERLLDEALAPATSPSVAEPAAPAEPKPAPVTWFGWQAGFGRKAGIPQWNLTEDVPGHPKDSTVGTKTLEDLGYAVPEAPEPEPPRQAAPTVEPTRPTVEESGQPVTAAVPEVAPTQKEFAPSATEILARFPNAEDGVEAVVARVPNGYSVALRDVDADQYVGAVTIFPTEEQALARAREIAAGKPPAPPTTPPKPVPPVEPTLAPQAPPSAPEPPPAAPETPRAPEAVTPAPEARPAAPPAMAGFSLPPRLAGAKPRFGFGSKNFTLDFAQDLDRALFIVAQEKPSAADADYLAALRGVYGEGNDDLIRELGRQVRARMKVVVTGKSDAQPIAIPAITKAPKARSAPATQPPVAPPATPEATPPTLPASPPEPWEITQHTFMENEARKRIAGRRTVPVLDARDRDKHEAAVGQAVAEGKPVPEHVLRDYPDLARPAAPAPEPRRSPEPHDFSSTQIEVPTDIANQIVRWARENIDPKDLAEDGIEQNPHVTVLYGLHTADRADIERVVADAGPASASLGWLQAFTHEGEPDVLYVVVASSDLSRLHGALASGLENTQTQPEYTPHATVAYLKPGRAQKYVRQRIPGVTGAAFTADRLSFMPKEGEPASIELSRETPAQIPAAPSEPAAAQPAEPAAPESEARSKPAAPPKPTKPRTPKAATLPGRSEGAFTPKNPFMLIRFVHAAGDIAPSSTGDLKGEYADTPARFKSRRGLSPDRMAEAISEAWGQPYSDAQLLADLKRIDRTKAEWEARARRLEEEAERIPDDVPDEVFDDALAGRSGVPAETIESALDALAAEPLADDVIDTISKGENAPEDSEAHRRALDLADAVAELVDAAGGFTEALRDAGTMIDDYTTPGGRGVVSVRLTRAQVTALLEYTYGGIAPAPVEGAEGTDDTEDDASRAVRPDQAGTGRAAEVPGDGGRSPARAEPEARREDERDVPAAERGLEPGPERPAAPERERPQAPVAPEPRTERTPLGDQVLVPGTPTRTVPTTRLRPEEPQRGVEETPLFGQERAQREAESEAAQGGLFAPMRSDAALETKAIERFGVTDDPARIGYILRDGQGLDFGGREHEGIWRIFPGNEPDPIAAFVERAGAVRFARPGGKIPGLVEAKSLTPAQARAITAAMRDVPSGTVIVDVGGEYASLDLSLDRQRFNAMIHGAASVDVAEQRSEGRRAIGIRGRGAKALAGNLYAGSVPKVAAKEAVQNAIDGIRSLPDPSVGVVTVNYDTKTKTLTVEDNGSGMTPEVATGELLDIGGTDKPEGASGGFGLAKAVLFSHAKMLDIVTTARGTETRPPTVLERFRRQGPQPKLVTTTIRGSGAEWLGEGLRWQTDDAPPSATTGTRLRIEFDDEVKGEAGAVREYFRELTQYSRLPIRLRLSVDGTPVTAPTTPDLIQRETLAVPGAEVDIYTSDVREMTSWNILSYRVLNQGMPQFSGAINLPHDMSLPKEVVVDVRATAAPESLEYPFTASREQVKPDVLRAVGAWMRKVLVREAVEAESSRYQQAIEASPVIGGTSGGLRIGGTNAHRVIDTTQTLDPALLEEIAASPEMRELSDLLQSAMHQLRATLSTLDPAMGNVVYGGLGLSDAYIAANFHGAVIEGLQQVPDPDVSQQRAAPPPPQNFILVGPFEAYRVFVKGRIDKGQFRQQDGPRLLASSLASSLLHELTHQTERGHNENFTTAITEYMGHAARALVQIEDRLLDLLTRDDNAAYRQITGYTDRIRFGSRGDVFRQAIAGLAEPTGRPLDQGGVEGGPGRGRGPGAPVPGHGQRPAGDLGARAPVRERPAGVAPGRTFRPSDEPAGELVVQRNAQGRTFLPIAEAEALAAELDAIGYEVEVRPLGEKLGRVYARPPAEPGATIAPVTPSGGPGAQEPTPSKPPEPVGGIPKTDEATGLPLNPDGTVTVYHGTTAAGAAEIRRTGRVKSAAEPDVYVTTDPAGGGYGDGTVVAVRVKPDLLTLDDEFPDGRRDFRVSAGKPGGSVAVTPEPTPSTPPEPALPSMATPSPSEAPEAVAPEPSVTPEPPRAVEAPPRRAQPEIQADRPRTTESLLPTTQSESPTMPGYRRPRTEAERADLEDKRKLIRRMEAVFDVPVRVGRFTQPGARGIFKVKPEVIRIRAASNLPTAAHEYGHFLRKRGLIDPAGFEDRLGELAANLAGDPLNEGIAEFVRLYVVTPAELADRGLDPLVDRFESRMRQAWPEGLAVLLDVRERYALWREQPTLARIISTVDYAKKARGWHWLTQTLPGMTDQARYREWWHRFYTIGFDDLHPIKLLEQAATKGRQLSADMSAYIVARLTRGEGGRTEVFLNEGPIDFNTLEIRRDIPSLKDILGKRRTIARPAGVGEVLAEPVWKHREQFEGYLLARRAIELVEAVGDVPLRIETTQRQIEALSGEDADPSSARERAILEAQLKRLQADLRNRERLARAGGHLLSQWERSIRDLHEAVAEVERERPEFAEAARELYAWNDALIDYLAASGRYDPAVIDNIRELHRNYVPLYRVFEEHPDDIAVPGGGNRFADLPSPFKRLKGSERRIASPLEGMLKNAYAMIAVADRNEVGNLIIDMLERTEGYGKLMEPVPPRMQGTTFALSEVGREIRGALEDAGVDLEQADIDLDRLATVFRPVYGREPNVLTIYRDGQPQQWLVDPWIYRAMMNLDRFQLPFLSRLMQIPAKVFRSGVVLSPIFQIRNFLRDQQTIGIQSRGIPFLGYTNAILDAVNAGHLKADWQAAGGAIFATLAHDRESLEQTLQDLMTGKRQRLKEMVDVRHPIEMGRAYLKSVAALTELSESPTRIGVFAREIAAPRPEDAGARRPERARRLRAAYESREASIDFRRGGALRAYTQLVAFLGPNLQGIDKFVRVHGNHPFKMALVGALLVGLEWWLHEWNKEQREYDNVPGWRRDLFYNLVLPDGWELPTPWGPIKTLSLPGAFEYKVVYSAVPRRIFEWLDGQDPDIARRLWDTMARGFGIDVIPTFAKPLVENFAEWTTFTDRPMIGRGLEDLLPAEQFTPHTSELAKRIGAALEYAPVKIDNLIRGYTGTLGSELTKALDDLFADQDYGAKTTPQVGDRHILRGFVVRSPNLSAEPIERFYEYHERAQQTAKTRNRLKRDGRLTPAWEREHVWELAESAALAHQARRFSTDRKALVEIDRDRTLSGDEKRRRIDGVVRGMIDAARSKVEGVVLLRATFTGALEALYPGRDPGSLTDAEFRTLAQEVVRRLARRPRAAP